MKTNIRIQLLTFVIAIAVSMQSFTAFCGGSMCGTGQPVKPYINSPTGDQAAPNIKNNYLPPHVNLDEKQITQLRVIAHVLGEIDGLWYYRFSDVSYLGNNPVIGFFQERANCFYNYDHGMGDMYSNSFNATVEKLIKREDANFVKIKPGRELVDIRSRVGEIQNLNPGLLEQAVQDMGKIDSNAINMFFCMSSSATDSSDFGKILRWIKESRKQWIEDMISKEVSNYYASENTLLPVSSGFNIPGGAALK